MRAPEEEAIRDHADAVRTAIDHMGVDEGERNVLLAHQFVTGGCSDVELVC